MSTRREELTRTAARLFAERGYHGTSLADLAEALGIQKASLYHHIASKEDLLWEVTRSGADAFHAALDSVPDDAPATEKIRIALRGHLLEA
jgi:AcrR family transcriptional regulator